MLALLVKLLAVWNSMKYFLFAAVLLGSGLMKPLKAEAMVFLESNRLVRTIPAGSPSAIKSAIKAS